MSKLSLNEMIAAALFAALIAVGAWISIPLPFSRVPIVLANMFVLLAGALLGKKLGTVSVAVYLLLGLAGVPVFAGFTSGAGVFAGPTGGYLIGYLLAALVTGVLVEHLPRPLPQLPRLAISLTAGAAVIYVPGVAWLAHSLGVNLQTALAQGFYYFLPGDALKIIVAVVLCRSLTQVPQLWRPLAGKGIVRHAETE